MRYTPFARMSVSQIDYAIVPKPHPPEYLAHKYWARKPHNVVAEYIAHYSSPGETVFDPFVGSGVTVLEALRLGRKAVAVDLDPTAIFITRNTSKPISLAAFDLAFQQLAKAVEKGIQALYAWKCKKCSRHVHVFQTIWQFKAGNHLPTMLKYRCPCTQGSGLIVENLNARQSRTLAARRYTTRFWYPKLRLIANSRINIHDGMTVPDLFTRRNLCALSMLRDKIAKLRRTDIREALLFVFTSGLAQVSKIHSIDMRPGREWASRGWTARGYWIPEGFIEENVWAAFASRYHKARSAKERLQAAGIEYREGKHFDDLRKNATLMLLNQSSTDLNNIPDNSIDYVFTDPPPTETTYPTWNCTKSGGRGSNLNLTSNERS